MTPFSDIDAKRLKRLRDQMDEFIDATVWWNDQPQWKSWFAWHPVRVHGKLTWLKTVYRRPVWRLSDTFNTHYEHGTILDVLNG